MDFRASCRDVFSNGHDWKAELRPALRDYVQKNLIVDRMLDGFRAADKFVAERSKERRRACRLMGAHSAYGEPCVSDTSTPSAWP